MWSGHVHGHIHGKTWSESLPDKGFHLGVGWGQMNTGGNEEFLE